MQLKPYSNLMDNLNFWKEKFFEDKSVRDLKEASLKHYQRAFKHFFEYIKEYQDEIDIDEINSLIFKGFINHLKDKGLSPVSIKDYFIIIKNFFMFITAENRDLKDYTKALSSIKIKVPKKRKEIFYKNELEKVETYLSNKIKERGSYTDYRNFLMFKIFKETGMRVSSLIKLRFNDFQEIEYEGKKCYAIRIMQKNYKENTVYILKDKIEFEFNRMLAFKNFNKDKYIFTSQTNENPISRQQVFNILTKAYKEAGILKSGVHILRHSLVYMKREQGVDLSTIQAILGHSSIVTTINIYGKADEVNKIKASII